MSQFFKFTAVEEATCDGCGKKKKCTHLGTTVPRDLLPDTPSGLLVCHTCKVWLMGKMRGRLA